MSDRTQDLKNLRAVATRCKNYTDAEIAKSEEKMKWYMGEYSVSTSDDNTSASTKTVPANATRCKIKRIYGLTQKLNPTTASDSTSYSVKTMPATVYDFDISKVEGNSEKSENLIVLNDVAETTTSSGLTFKVQDGAIYFNSSGLSSNVTLILNLAQPITVTDSAVFSSYSGISTSYSTQWYLTSNSSTTASGGYRSSNKFLTNSQSVSNTTLNNPDGHNTYNQIYVFVSSVATFSNVIFKPMLVSGSTAPTEYKQGYTGIHNFEWNGVKVKNSDDEVMQNISIDLSSITYNGSPLFEGNSLKAVNDVKDSVTPYKATKKLGYVDLGTLTPTYDSTNKKFNYTGITNIKAGVNSQPANILMNGYTTKATDYIIGNLSVDMLIGLSNSKTLSVRNLAYTDATTFKQAMSGVYLVYELATPIEVSINWASLLRGITGYSNGTISLLNTNNQDTANLITYNSIIKENCCAKMVQSRGGTAIKTVTFPTQASDGYSAGSASNVRDYTTNKRETNVDKVDLGLYDWIMYNNNANVFHYNSLNVKEVSANTDTGNLLCRIYTSDNVNNVWLKAENKTIAVNTSKHVQIYDNYYADASTFKTANSGNNLYYELADASKTSTDITPIENVLEVQPGDELAFYDANDNLVTIPSDLTYRIEVAS